MLLQFSYVVITCDKYHDRLDAIKSTWAKDVDLIVLGDSLTNVVGYQSCPYKYLQYFRAAEGFKSDWYVFVDDDTFVKVAAFEERLIELYEKDRPVTVGLYSTGDVPAQKMLISGKFPKKSLNFPRGGAGFAINRNGMEKIKALIDTLPDLDVPITENSDTTITMWMDMAGTFQKHVEKRLRRRLVEDIRSNDVLSSHYVIPEKMKEFYLLLKE